MPEAQSDVVPPRQLTEIYGDVVAEQHDGDEYWEAYSHPEPDSEHLLFVAYYVLEDDKWVKQGLDRHEVKNLFSETTWPID